MVVAKSNIQGLCLLLRLQPVTLNRPQPPFSISAPLHPDHLASACHCILQSLDMKKKKGERKTKSKVLRKLHGRQMSERLERVRFWILACAWFAPLSMLRNWRIDLAAFLQRNARTPIVNNTPWQPCKEQQRVGRDFIYFVFLILVCCCLSWRADGVNWRVWETSLWFRSWNVGIF